MIFAGQPCFSMPLPGHRLTTVDHPVPRSSCRRHTCMAQDYRLVATGAAPTGAPCLLNSSPELVVEQLAAAPSLFFFLQLRGKPGLSSAQAHQALAAQLQQAGSGPDRFQAHAGALFSLLLGLQQREHSLPKPALFLGRHRYSDFSRNGGRRRYRYGDILGGTHTKFFWTKALLVF